MWKRKPKEAEAGKITQGGPSGFVISLVIHAALFVLAGLLVVFTVQQKEEKKFVPPAPVERPKMQLKSEGESKENGEAEADTANCDEDEVGKHAGYSTTRIEWGCGWIKCRSRWI